MSGGAPQPALSLPKGWMKIVGVDRLEAYPTFFLRVLRVSA